MSCAVPSALPSDYLALLSQLNGVEAQFLPAPCQEQLCYIRFDNYLVRPSQVIRALPRALVRKQIDPILKLRHLGKFARCYLAGKTERLPSSACMIQARPHWRESGMFRGYYPQSGTSIKVAIGSEKGHRRIRNEIRVRQVVEEIGKIGTPKMLGHCDDSHCVAVHEAWIHGRSFRRHRDLRTLKNALLPQLEDHYRKYGIDEIDSTEVMRPGFTDRVTEAAELFRWPAEWLDKSRLLGMVRDLENRQLAFPGSFCHGDLATGHVLFDQNGAPIVIDWDSGGEHPIARDLADLCRSTRPYDTPFVERCIQILDNFSTPSTHSPIAQLLILSLRRAAKFQRLQATFIQEGRGESVGPMIATGFGLAQQLAQRMISQADHAAGVRATRSPMRAA